MTADRFRALVSALRIPAAVAPMTAVSTPRLVAESCRAGVIGSFPTSNAQSSAQLDEWFDEIDTLVGDVPSVLMANLIVGRQNERLDADLMCIARRRVPFVVTSVGNPVPVIAPLQEAGKLVLVSVVSLAHAQKALEAGADGLVLLGAGGGGHTGWANPLAFVRAVRALTQAPLIAAGGISDGASLWAAIVAGYDLGMFGTRFIATPESGAGDAWRDALVRCTMDDVTVGTAPNGVTASLLRGGGGSCGHSVSAISRLATTGEVVDELAADWLQARSLTSNMLRDTAATHA